MRIDDDWNARCVALNSEWDLSSGDSCRITDKGGPLFGKHLLMDEGPATDTSILYLKLDSNLNYTLEFWMKNFGRGFPIYTKYVTCSPT